MEPSATSTTVTRVTRPVGERLQVGTEDAPVLDCPAPLRRFHDSDAADLLVKQVNTRSSATAETAGVTI